MSARTDRIELRVDPQDKRRLQQAADETGTTLSSFVLDTALSRADEILPGQTMVPAAYFDTLIRAMHEPPEEMARLADAASEPSPFTVR